jgi:hypothetical protein
VFSPWARNVLRHTDDVPLAPVGAGQAEALAYRVAFGKYRVTSDWETTATDAESAVSTSEIEPLVRLAVAPRRPACRCPHTVEHNARGS